ncbi:MAG: hypothetical protein ACRC2R_11460 [Xenococcaceae cyanobacterium]
MQRYSSRRKGLDKDFINQKLKGAVSYDRIAGFFRSSILEVAGEALEKLDGTIKVVCNSDLSLQDVETAKAANKQSAVLGVRVSPNSYQNCLILDLLGCLNFWLKAKCKCGYCPMKFSD